MPTIKPDELANRKAQYKIVDIRKAPDDRQIPGSVRDMAFAKDEDVVLYCGSGNSCVRVADEMRERGYRTVALEGGYKAWVDAGLPTEDRVSG